MCTHLSKRGAVYYFRRAIPEDIRHRFEGKREWLVSLRTKDRTQAKQAVRFHSIETDSLIENAQDENVLAVRAQTADTSLPPDGPIVPVTERAAFEAQEAAERQVRWDARKEHRSLLRHRLRLTTAQMRPEDAAVMDIVREERADRNELERANELLRTQIADLLGQRGYPQATVHPHVKVAIAECTQPVTFTKLLEGYFAESRPSLSTIQNWTPYIANIGAFLGHDDATRLTGNDVVAWKDKLISTPGRQGKPLSAKTVNHGYLAALNVVLNWGVRNRKLSENLAAGVKVTAPKAVSLRSKAFTDHEAALILGASLATSDADLADYAGFARRWIPWLCAYTGARVNELTQLRRLDVRQEDGGWIIAITPEAGTVKGGKARLVPLHSHMVDQGFIEAIDARPGERLFFDPSKSKSSTPLSQQAKKAGEKLAQWVRGLGIDDPSLLPNHAWRHRFKTMSRSVNMDTEAAHAIQGHTSTSIGGQYGNWPMSRLRTEIEKIARYDL